MDLKNNHRYTNSKDCGDQTEGICTFLGYFGQMSKVVMTINKRIKQIHRGIIFHIFIYTVGKNTFCLWPSPFLSAINMSFICFQSMKK